MPTFIDAKKDEGDKRTKTRCESCDPETSSKWAKLEVVPTGPHCYCFENHDYVMGKHFSC